MTFQHVPVLLQETLSGLNIQPEGIYVDGTVGGAGHACEIAKQLHGAGRLIGLDRDPDAVAVATQRLAPYPATVIHANYDEMAQVLQRLEIPAVDGILLDLGVSSHQLDTEERGFSYHTDAPLDMRMSQSGMSAADVVNTWSQEELTRILFAYGEESFARAIARNICQARQEQPITTTLQLESSRNALLSHALIFPFFTDANDPSKEYPAASASATLPVYSSISLNF